VAKRGVPIAREPSGPGRCSSKYIRSKEEAIDDAEAVARARDGDLDAYTVLVARYTLRAHRAAFLLGAGEETDDVVQEAFVKAFQHLVRFRVGEPFGPWLLRIVANETKNLTRSRRRRAALALRMPRTEAGDMASPGPVDDVLAAERRAQLVAAVDALPDKERQVLTCRYFLDLSEAETAQVLGWPRGSVKSRTSRALSRLRGHLVPGEQTRIPSG
jgi:RNA polymerase sigma factor (sigma-70 family)